MIQVKGVGGGLMKSSDDFFVIDVYYRAAGPIASWGVGGGGGVGSK